MTFHLFFELPDAIEDDLDLANCILFFFCKFLCVCR